MISHFKKAAKLLIFGSMATLLLGFTAFAADADIATGVGATTGSSLRLRAEPSTDSQVITTLGKHVAVAILPDSTEEWFHISYSGQEGFVSADYLVVDQDNLFSTYGRVNSDIVNLRAEANTEAEILASLEKDTYVDVSAFEDGWYKVTCEYGTEGYIRSDFLDLCADKSTASATGSAIVNEALKHLGTHYVYGGSTPKGFDCSGFTMYLYGTQGISLPHSASAQWQSGKGTRHTNVSELAPGDLVFFNDPSRNRGRACSHAGIYLGGGEFIHASSARSGGVKISDLTEGYYQRYFVGGIHI